MKSFEKINQKIYAQVAEEFGLNVKVVEAIIKSQWILVKREIEDSDSWGKINLMMFGKFTVQPKAKRINSDKPFKKITKYE